MKYEIGSLQRSPSGPEGHLHITEVGLLQQGRPPLRQPIAAVLDAIAAGRRVYFIHDTDGPVVFIRPDRCSCGVETIRAVTSTSGLDALERLAPGR